MSELLERVKLNLLVYGHGIADNFKNNSLFFYEKYQKSDQLVRSISLSDIQMGGFYFFHYKDDSNWMKYSPVFTMDFKKFGNMTIILAINFNFIPFEVRVTIFDNFISEQDFEKDTLLKADFQGVYNELRKYGFEYAICEYNVAQMVLAHKISMEMVPRFLYSGYPANKYDPNKLYSIWKAKIVNREARDAEMKKSLLSDFFNVSNDIEENYQQLKGHIQRLQKSVNKYG